MKLKLRDVIEVPVLLVAGLYPLFSASGGENNQAPEIRVLWPTNGVRVAPGFAFKLKADVSSDAGTTVTQVQFYASTNVIGTVTNAPFNFVWYGDLPGVDFGFFDLTAGAVDSFGRRAESAPVHLYYSGTGISTLVVEMQSPRDGSVFAAPATFVFGAEVLVSQGDAGPVEFFVDNNSVGVVPGSHVLRATTPPVSVVVSNLAEGEHRLRVQYLGGASGGCSCNWITSIIRVVRLEMRSPRLTPEARFQFDVVASLPGIKTIVQMSPDLLAWTPVATNQPPGTTFTLTDPYPATNAQAFYRVALPPP